MEDTQVIDYIKQAFELKESKNYKPAIEMLYKALEIENDNVEILFQIGELYFLLNNYSRAMQYLEKSSMLNPVHSSTLKLTRTIKERQGDLDAVLSISNRLFEEYPSVDNLKDLIKILVKLKLFCEIDNYKSSEFFNSEVKIECATAFYSNGEQDKAKELLSECDLSDEKALLLSGRIKFDENDFEGAK